MRALPRLVVGTLVATALAVGCASGPAPASGARSCEAREKSAREEISAAIDANNACSQDSDCQKISFSSACFDSCDRAVNQAGVSAFEAAKTKVNAGTCATYVQDGCPRVVPPCVPPSAPACVSGRCQ